MFFYLPFRIGFPTTVGENKVYSNETHNGQDCETEVVGAVEDDRDEEVEVARLPALRHRCGLVPTSAFTYQALLRHYSKRALNPWSVDIKFGPRRNYHEPVPSDFCIASQFHVFLPWGQRLFRIDSVLIDS